MSTIRKIAFCPHCGNQSSQELIHSQVCEWVGHSLVADEALNLGRTYFVASCSTCNHILVYSTWGGDHDEEDYSEIFAESYLEYPDSDQLNLSIPAIIREIYEGAKRVKISNPDAFAVQVRRVLEALCNDRGAKGRNLQEKIKDLVSREELPATFGDAADLLQHLEAV
jgi:hypothetical protein